MAYKEIRIGSLPGFLYNDGDYSEAIETTEPIKAGAPVDPSDVLRLADVGTAVGDVIGPAGATSSNLVEFDGVTGKKLKDGGLSHADVADAIAKKHTQGTDTTIDLPHLMQSDSTDQAIANVANAQVITFDTDVHHHNIARTSSSRFTIASAGSYLITFSGVCLSGVAGKRIEVWLRVDGADVANSNTIYIFKAANANTVISVSFIMHFNAGQYFEFWTWGDDLGVKWDATAAGALPTRPACPSIIITCNYISGD